MLKSSIKERQTFTVEKGKQSEEDRYKKLCERERERERETEEVSRGEIFELFLGPKS